MITQKIRDVVMSQATTAIERTLLTGANQASWAVGVLYRAQRDALLERIRESLPDGWSAVLANHACKGHQRRLFLVSPNDEYYDWLTEEKTPDDYLGWFQ